MVEGVKATCERSDYVIETSPVREAIGPMAMAIFREKIRLQLTEAS